jgi:6-phosphogluconolactonase
VKRRTSSIAASVYVLLALVACGGDGNGGGSTVTYTLGGTISGLTGSGLVLGNNGADDLAVTANGAFKFAIPVPNDTAYSVTVLTQPSDPSQNCVISNGTDNGTISNADVTSVAVICNNVGRFAYVANLASNNVSAYSINAATGTLTPVPGSPFATAGADAFITLHPSGKFSYVADNSLSSISAYAIDASTGALTELAGSPFAAGTNPANVTIDPSGKFAYAANQISGNISAYTIDATTGTLSPVSGSPYASGNYPSGVVIDPSGKFAYVTNYGIPMVGTWSGGSLSAYTINASTGALTPVAGTPFAANCPCVFTIAPSGKFAYLTTNSGGGVYVYSIDTNTGALTQTQSVAGRSGNCPGQTRAVVYSTCGVMITPNGKFAYVPSFDNTGNTVYAYTIGSTTGALTAVAGSPYPIVGQNSLSVSFDPGGRFAYVLSPYYGTSSNEPGVVLAFTIDATTGALTAITGSPFEAGVFPTYFTLDPSGKFAYAAEGTMSNVSAYPIGGFAVDGMTGALATVPGSPFLAGMGPESLVVLN